MSSHSKRHFAGHTAMSTQPTTADERLSARKAVVRASDKPARSPLALFGGGLMVGLLGVSSTLTAQTFSVDIETTGYMRAGTGINTDGGRMTCFQLPGTDYKWRLGNECDYILEPLIDVGMAEGADDSRWGMRLMPTATQAFDDPDGDLDARFGQAYIYGEDLPQLADGRIWAGRRFYDRVGFHINDFFMELRDNDGVGIEDMDVGVGKLSYAFLMSPFQDADSSNMTHSLRLTEIETVPGSFLDIYTAYSHNHSTTEADPGIENDDGISVGLYHTTTETLGGDTRIGIQYRNFPEPDAVQHPAAQDQDGDLYRIIVQQTGYIDVFDTSWEVIGHYRSRDFDDGTQDDWYSLGGRTDTHLGGPFRFLFELGHDRLSPDEGDTIHLTKATAALALSAGPDQFSRPTVRFFVTHARWNDEVNEVGGPLTNVDEDTTVFAGDTSGTTIGAQAETFW